MTINDVLPLPPGIRFNPTDDELISYYLSNKIKGIPLPLNLIVECDIYGDKPPWEICHGRKQEECYFFTTLKKASKNRVARTAAGGEWRGNNSGKEVMDRKTKKVIGVKKQFTFKPRKGKKGTSCTSTSNAKATGWIMHEYSLMGGKDSSDGYALCHITKHCRGQKKDDDGEPIIITNQLVFDRYVSSQEARPGEFNNQVNIGGFYQGYAFEDADNQNNSGEAAMAENLARHQVHLIKDGDQINNREAVVAENAMFDQVRMIEDGNQIKNGGLYAIEDADDQLNNREVVMGETLMFDQAYVNEGGNQINNGSPTAMTGAGIITNTVAPREELQTEYGMEPEWAYLEKGSWFSDFDPAEIARMSTALDDAIAKNAFS
ncbi:NAC domain-containing protein 53 [Ricinus communis]|uniref:Transcription factor, putative n=1 Tax=Ricinus communis TaxID=3988 RepID=B9SIZ4_RICCO|nr:NAC domain-containing protein 53 [Ricinus communis]EEF36387.1 transcription factor, putative [Ricinus communis]|eukprot:XP_002525963.1 NAC domain-containing protein 53 [Ricinus communis]